jgi:catechol 2,3-dioxygenase-like lactoylglutathione lyase family enzyme
VRGSTASRSDDARKSLWASTTSPFRCRTPKPYGSLESLTALLDEAGAAIVEGPVARRGARQADASSVYVRDPDENLLEFMIYS